LPSLEWALLGVHRSGADGWQICLHCLAWQANRSERASRSSDLAKTWVSNPRDAPQSPAPSRPLAPSSSGPPISSWPNSCSAHLSTACSLSMPEQLTASCVSQQAISTVPSSRKIVLGTNGEFGRGWVDWVRCLSFDIKELHQKIFISFAIR
jgi:hypothetical protein